MLAVEVENGTTPEITAEMVLAQLELLVRDEAFRSSKRSVAFLRFVVEQTLAGQAEQIKERSIGVEVFARHPAYDTNSDHVVRTAATELRKRLATYYVDPRHRDELRVALVPGSYIPRFTLPPQTAHEETYPRHEETDGHGALHAAAAPAPTVPEPVVAPVSPDPRTGQPQTEPRIKHLQARWQWAVAVVLLLAAAGVTGYRFFRGNDPQTLFWRPILNTPGAVQIIVGDHPNGPPELPSDIPLESLPTPVPGLDSSETVPFADTITIARVTGILSAHSKPVLIRPSSVSSFSDLRQGAAILIGAFNNEWSLRLTRQMRFSLALDAGRHIIYIRDAQNPASRTWSWATNQSRTPAIGANSPKTEDYALISRIHDSETGHAVVIIGGLYTYGTQAAGEFLTDPGMMREIVRQANLGRSDGNLQIVIATTVTDGTPGPPRVLAVSTE
jgi:hypothetical protein